MSDDRIARAPSVVVDTEEMVDDPNQPKLGEWYRLRVRFHYVYRPATEEEVNAPLTEDERRYHNPAYALRERFKPKYEENADGERSVVKEVLGCVIHIGSNYAELKFPETWASEGTDADRMHGTVRVHLDNFADECTHVPDGAKLLEAEIGERQLKAKQLMARMQEIAKSLNVGEEHAQLGAGETAAIALRGDGSAVTKYRADLVHAKERTFPLIQSHIKWEMRAAASLMLGTMFPLEVQIGKIEPLIERVQAKVFKVDLYAGLSEEVVQIRDGAPAAREEKLHLFQRRHYMDEECLLNYTAGGMRFDHIEDFDAWLAKPVNFSRILPHPRSVVAFQVRRETYRYDEPEAQFRQKIQVSIQQEIDAQRRDRYTFMYLRNGGRLYRFTTKLQFDEKLFPDLDKMTLTGALYFKKSGGEFEFISEGDFLERLKEHERRKAEYDAMSEEQQKDADRKASHASSFTHRYVPPDPRDSYSKLQPSETVYYDDAMADLTRQMEEHNRLVLILQGLLDRSDVFAPHPPWRIWEAEGFNAALTLVHDTSRALAPGEAPDFDAYFKKLNEQIRVGTVTIGQQDLWMEREGEKETARRENDWRIKDHDTHVKRYKPEGNPGPGVLAPIVKLSRDKTKATFRWWKKRLRDGGGRFYTPPEKRAGTPMPAAIVVDASKLFNADAYTPGDYKRFFADPRTRAEYLKWAPFLLTAEDYKAGKLKADAGRVEDASAPAEETED